MAVVEVVATAFWLMLPAYVPNNVAVLVGGGPPIDGGRSYGDSRLLGDGKTWRGSVGGIAAGSLLALGLNAAEPSIRPVLGFALPSFPLHAGVALATGAILGDIGASFLKRRTGRERGAAFPGVDQLDFVVGAFVVTIPVAFGWFTSNFTPGVLVVVLVITPILHVGTNWIAYQLGLKDEPW